LVLMRYSCILKDAISLMAGPSGVLGD